MECAQQRNTKHRSKELAWLGRAGEQLEHGWGDGYWRLKSRLPGTRSDARGRSGSRGVLPTGDHRSKGLLNRAGTELHRIDTTEEENRQGRGEPSRQYRKWGTRTPKEDENQIEPMRKSDTRQSKTKIGITSIRRTESGALCSDRREIWPKKRTQEKIDNEQ
jgi:hypothetical protein